MTGFYMKRNIWLKWFTAKVKTHSNIDLDFQQNSLLPFDLVKYEVVFIFKIPKFLPK